MLELIPSTVKAARIFVGLHHRHHSPPRGGLFAVAVQRTGDLLHVGSAPPVVGVAIIGRPVARRLQDGRTAEVTRLCVLDGSAGRMACSMLYAAAWRAARALGYKRLVTYILAEEAGTSLRAAGWHCVGEAGGGSWSRPSRTRDDKHPLQTKMRWEIG